LWCMDVQFASMRETCVYILASRSRRLYIGVTSNLIRRIYQHRTGEIGHTARYRITRLVYFEIFSRPIDAIEREKRLKSLLRSKKLALIEARNPTWEDLARDWFEPSSSNDTTAGKAGPPAAARPSG
jgi:putative endonuclease